MARECELSGVKPIIGHNVSHSNIKTKRRFLPNLVRVTLRSEALDRAFPMRIAAKTLRTVDKLGGLDAYLAKAKDEKLSEKALKIKRDIAKKAEGVEA
ncbi:50S ribosomal protein L28 [Henriciella mobilis]|uniref:Large ribosomal subunit protein bL28 n=1 Tax=Henriciella mobilis TaxID=2305467 RepID=A0A399RKK2_9PROT|nr:50S ribosomal protein L28 [Henriciella mobilis]RIJ17874.1 50S ribosomal protein L28 [Henriciella mobilis]RIJ25314.1 50S ribosomal protein L28 [Henriciella mobilis]RIJ30382.1 50S ribosomal protein L28 [Henriciella mobilis]